MPPPGLPPAPALRTLLLLLLRLRHCRLHHHRACVRDVSQVLACGHSTVFRAFAARARSSLRQTMAVVAMLAQVLWISMFVCSLSKYLDGSVYKNLEFSIALERLR